MRFFDHLVVAYFFGPPCTWCSPKKKIINPLPNYKKNRTIKPTIELRFLCQIKV